MFFGFFLMALSLHWFMTFISFPMFLRYKLLRVGFKTGVSISFGSKKQLGIFLGVDVVGRGVEGRGDSEVLQQTGCLL